VGPLSAVVRSSAFHARECCMHRRAGSLAVLEAHTSADLGLRWTRAVSWRRSVEPAYFQGLPTHVAQLKGYEDAMSRNTAAANSGSGCTSTAVRRTRVSLHWYCCGHGITFIGSQQRTPDHQHYQQLRMKQLLPAGSSRTVLAIGHWQLGTGQAGTRHAAAGPATGCTAG
jgi:hypothetical protein